jgi:hypothetical protein
MNKNKNQHENNYGLIVKALQKGYEKYPETWIRLYLSKENKLDHISFNEAKEIIDSMCHDGLLEKNHDANESAFMISRDPTPYPNAAPTIQGDWPYNPFPFNYFSVGIEEKFSKVTSAFGSPLFLLSIMPKDRKYKYLTKMAKLFVDAGVDSEVETYKLALCFRSDLRKNEFLNNKTTYSKQMKKIKNRRKTLNKLLKPKGYTVKLNEKANTAKLVKI